MSSADLVDRYALALGTGQSAALIGLLCPEPRFVSPFSVWSTPSAVASAYVARTIAFGTVTIVRVFSDVDGGVVRWHGRVGEHEIDGVDVLGLQGGAISTVDVFLRPADALDAVYAAMTAAWPR